MNVKTTFYYCTTLHVLSQVSGGNEAVETAVYILTTMVVLETAQHVLNIGQGIAEVDMSALTLHQIKNTVKRIEGKVDKILKEPLNSAKFYFDNAIIEITNKSYNDAYQTLDKVIENAMKGLGYAGDSVESFEECAKATRLIVFSTILRHSYDEERQCFKPIFMLSEEKQILIGEKLESMVEELERRKANVRIRIFETKVKSRVQDMFDSVLKIVYPYVSHARKWTDMKRIVEKKVKLPLMPKYLQDGEANSAEIIVGVRDESSVVKVNVWREKDNVCCKYEAKIFRKAIKQNSELVNIVWVLDLCPGPITLSLTGTAVLKRPEYDGEYVVTDQEHNAQLATMSRPARWQYQARSHLLHIFW